MTREKIDVNQFLNDAERLVVQHQEALTEIERLGKIIRCKDHMAAFLKKGKPIPEAVWRQLEALGRP